MFSAWGGTQCLLREKQHKLYVNNGRGSVPMKFYLQRQGAEHGIGPRVVGGGFADPVVRKQHCFTAERNTDFDRLQQGFSRVTSTIYNCCRMDFHSNPSPVPL